MRIRIVLLMALAFACSPWFASAQPGPGRSFAFLVACGDYDPSELKPVPFTLHEMKLFRDVLIASGVPAGNIVHLHDETDKPGRFIPNRANILKEYKLLLERLRPEDSLVVALSGHGIQYKTDTSGYFCPLDARLGAIHKETLVAMEGPAGLLTLLEKTKARRKLVLVNACRNDPATNAFLATEKLELRDDYNEEPPKGTVVMFACGKGQRSYFYPETEKRTDRRNRSLFMYHLTEAWKGSYAKGIKVTLDHVLSEVRDRVEDEAPRDFRNNQMPLAKKKNFEGSWVLASHVKRIFEPQYLTGKNVVFLIDVSGSMLMKDEVTLDPDKWPLLCDTLAQLMGSLPEIQRFQVILFSDKTSHLWGNRDSWLKYETDTAKVTNNALRKFKVEGSTNTQAGFEEAFRYRDKGLDTIFLLTDGMPNVGDGLPADLKNATEEQMNLHMGKFVRDKLRTDWNRPIAGKEAVRINTLGFYFKGPNISEYFAPLSSEHGGKYVDIR